MFAYPGLQFDEPEETEKEEAFEIVYVFEDLLSLFHIYQTARMYLGEDHMPNPTILTEVLKEEKLPLCKALADIAVIHNSYLSVVNPGKADG